MLSNIYRFVLDIGYLNHGEESQPLLDQNV